MDLADLESEGLSIYLFIKSCLCQHLGKPDDTYILKVLAATQLKVAASLELLSDLGVSKCRYWALLLAKLHDCFKVYASESECV